MFKPAAQHVSCAGAVSARKWETRSQRDLLAKNSATTTSVVWDLIAYREFFLAIAVKSIATILNNAIDLSLGLGRTVGVIAPQQL